MTQKRLTNRQRNTLQARQAARLARGQSQTEATHNLDQNLGAEQPGLLIAHYGNTLIVENQAGQLFYCSRRQNLGALVTGDKVIWQPIDANSGVVVACGQRHSVITKPTPHGAKPMVANVDLILVMCALEPLPKQSTLDRYLIVGSQLNLPVLIIVNKCDLLGAAAQNLLLAKLKYYERIGYKVIKLSTKNAYGIDTLSAELKGKTSILVGQSGVGKSSLLNVLVPEAKAHTQALSNAQRLGRHTTTATKLYHLNEHSNVIDSPGIHEFKLQHFSQQQIKQGFIEFAPYWENCKFRNCTHTHEPECALQAAVRDGKIADFRLENYLIIATES